MSVAWKAFELRIAKALGGTRAGPIGAAVSDIVGVPWSVEVKRSARGGVYERWLTQARTQGKAERRPWLLVVARHYDRDPIAVLTFAEFLRLATAAGEIPDHPRSPTVDEVVDSIVNAADADAA